jgi:hypothetical protein
MCNSCCIIFPIKCRVIKAIEFSPDRYCAYGGYPQEVPLGTVGIVQDAEDAKITVRFDNGINWNLDERELKRSNEIVCQKE